MDNDSAIQNALLHKKPTQLRDETTRCNFPLFMKDRHLALLSTWTRTTKWDRVAQTQILRAHTKLTAVNLPDGREVRPSHREQHFVTGIHITNTASSTRR
jgi:hypothetical protein